MRKVVAAVAVAVSVPAVAVALAARSTTAPATAAPQPTGLARLVDPFVGTSGAGNTFPGVSAPFGMTQVSPDTGTRSGYSHDDDEIAGFGLTHLSGAGCGVGGELPIMPTTGAVRTDGYDSSFRHSDETAFPGYYRVILQRYGVDAELTATDRTAWQRFSYPAGESHQILFDVGRANLPVFGSQVRVVGDRTVEGAVVAGRFCGGDDRHILYFTSTFSTPFTSFGTWSGPTRHGGRRAASGGRGDRGAWVGFGADRRVTVKTALSYTGLAGARANLAAETGHGFDFDATQAALTARWNHELTRAVVHGGAAADRSVFATALYHALLHPNLAGDVDGRYRGADGRVRVAHGWTPRANFSLWDTYRTQNQLLELLEPRVARDVDLSILAQGRDTGWLPRWNLAGSEADMMTGDPVTPTLVDAWSKGLLAGHEDEAYGLLRRNATSVPRTGVNGRAGLPYYDHDGYLPFGLRAAACPDHGAQSDCSRPASATLEYAAADGSLALMARGLGHNADARFFATRSQSYRNLWDARLGQFRPRRADGSWLDPYDPTSGDTAFQESGAEQYTWAVPQDPSGLVELLGGRGAATRRLDTFFAYDDLARDSAKAIRHDWISEPDGYYAKRTYNPTNETDLAAPFLYSWTGRPAHTATIVRAAQDLFTATPGGLAGNDDLGELSSWYVMTALGLYPTLSGAGALTLSTPHFPSATVAIGRYGQQGGTLRITAPGVSEHARYVREVAAGGRATSRSWVSWDAVRHGGTLAYSVSDVPTSWGTSPADAPPAVLHATPAAHTSLAATVPAVAAAVGAPSVPLTVSTLAQWTGTRAVTTTVSAPPGWSAAPSRMTTPVAPHGRPTGTERTVRLTPTRGAGAGRYPVTVTLRAAGVAPVVRRATVTLARVHCTHASICPLDLAVGSQTSVMLRGQVLALPAGRFSSLTLRGAARGGSVHREVVVGYTDGHRAVLPFVFEAPSWTTSGLGVVVRDASGPESRVRLRLDPRRTVASLTLPDIPQARLYAATLAR